MGGFLFDAFNFSLSLLYLAGFSLLYRRARWQPLLHQLVPLGKMALTTYLVQTAFGLVLFYGLGFGLLGQISPAYCMLLAAPVFACQWAFSRWWLKRFRLGPVEWLWRSGTYLKWQRLRL
ncbi:MAG: DUF418 domain-containing protein [Bernardetiaceae bacterium]|nr:DUF418 domain-containing protein [Bernardetiaceae bacterium]